MVKEIEANLCFAKFKIQGKIFLKLQRVHSLGRQFWGGEIFLKIAMVTFLRYSVGRKFRQNHSISHG